MSPVFGVPELLILFFVVVILILSIVLPVVVILLLIRTFKKVASIEEMLKKDK